MVYSRALNNQATRNGQQKYYLLRIDLKKYNVIIDGRSFYDNPVESDIEKYRELKNVMIGKGEDYTAGSLLDYDYFKKNYKLVAVDLHAIGNKQIKASIFRLQAYDSIMFGYY